MDNEIPQASSFGRDWLTGEGADTTDMHEFGCASVEGARGQRSCAYYGIGTAIYIGIQARAER